MRVNRHFNIKELGIKRGEYWLKFGEDKGQMKCSFCGKTQEQVRKLVAGPGVYICDECVPKRKSATANISN